MKKEPGKYYKNAQAHKWILRPPKKKIVSLDKPQKPLPFNLDRWLDEIDPQWWILPDEIEPEEEAKNRLILKKKMKVAEGIETLLRLHRRLT